LFSLFPIFIFDGGKILRRHIFRRVFAWTATAYGQNGNPQKTKKAFSALFNLKPKNNKTEQQIHLDEEFIYYLATVR